MVLPQAVQSQVVSAAQVLGPAPSALWNLLEKLLEAGAMVDYLDRLLRNLRSEARHCSWWTWTNYYCSRGHSASSKDSSDDNLGTGTKAPHRNELASREIPELDSDMGHEP